MKKFKTEIKDFLTNFKGRDNVYLYADSPEVRSQVRTYINKFKNSYGEIRLPQNGDIELENLFTQLSKFDVDCEDELKNYPSNEFYEFDMEKKIKKIKINMLKIKIENWILNHKNLNLTLESERLWFVAYIDVCEDDIDLKGFLPVLRQLHGCIVKEQDSIKK